MFGFPFVFICVHSWFHISHPRFNWQPSLPQAKGSWPALTLFGWPHSVVKTSLAYDATESLTNEWLTNEWILARALRASQLNHSRGVLPRKFREVWPNPELLCFGPRASSFNSLAQRARKIAQKRSFRPNGSAVHLKCAPNGRPVGPETLLGICLQRPK